MLFKIILVIVILLAGLLILSGSIPTLSMLSPISNVLFLTFKFVFGILRATWPILIIIVAGYFLIKPRT